MKQLFLTSHITEVVESISAKVKIGKREKLMFVTTPAEVEEGDLWWLEEERKSVKSLGYECLDFTFKGKSRRDVESVLEKVQAMYVCGGNTFYLLQEIQKCDCEDLLKQFINSGKVYLGTSAGSQIVGPSIQPIYSDEVDKAPGLKSFEGLGLVDVVVFPHWGSEHFRKIYLQSRMKQAYADRFSILILSDFQYVWVRDGWIKVVDVREEDGE